MLYTGVFVALVWSALRPHASCARCVWSGSRLTIFNIDQRTRCSSSCDLQQRGRPSETNYIDVDSE